ncbi:MAG: hypothetical protein LBE21_01060 [Pseudomonadales bacterium]|jgi:hypothetical protein|nr:hypothetical protein [Pseudomonadales bacterium]
MQLHHHRAALLRTTLAAALAAACATPALAHHGIGLFQPEIDKSWSGTLTKMNLVNPHSYMELEVIGDDGQPMTMRCEMRAATLIRRSGWSTEMFVVGSHIEVQGHPHRDDPSACYIESFTIGEQTINRNDQLSTTAPVDTSNRAARLDSGEPNISGDWAVEQLVLTIPPSGGHGDMVPKSLIEEYAAGDITLQQIRALNPSARAQYTERGRAEADAFQMWTVADNPRLSCKPTSIIYDWTFDWPVNRVTQTTTAEGEKVIDMDYGLFSNTRRIHMDMAEHPANIEPSNTGHSIGHWEGDTLVVDTVGFEAGVLSPPTRNSDQMHVEERFTLDPATFALRREFTVTDPVYLTAPYAGADTVLLSEVPFERHPCEEMTPEFIAEMARQAEAEAAAAAAQEQ